MDHLSYDNINRRLDELHEQEKNAENEIKEMKDVVKNNSTSEERKTVTTAYLSDLNKRISAISTERLKLLDILQKRTESGMFLIYSMFSTSFYFF